MGQIRTYRRGNYFRLIQNDRVGLRTVLAHRLIGGHVTPGEIAERKYVENKGIVKSNFYRRSRKGDSGDVQEMWGQRCGDRDVGTRDAGTGYATAEREKVIGRSEPIKTNRDGNQLSYFPGRRDEGVKKIV